MTGSGEEYVDTEWCPECGRRREVVDRHTEESMSAYSNSYTTRFEEFSVVDFVCGHSKQGKTGNVRSERDAGA